MNKIKRFIVISLVLLLSFTSTSSIVSGASYQNLYILMLNVGAGDSFYIEMPNGDDILTDGGTKSWGYKVVEYLKKLEPGMTLEAVVSTHPDSDHSGGLQPVFDKMVVKSFYYPTDAGYTSDTAKRLIALSKKEKGCKIYNAKPGIKLFGGNGAYLKFCHRNYNYNTPNKDSVMSYIKYNKLDVLLTGDADNGAEHYDIKRANLDIVQAPHHGSKTSSSSEYIKAFDPEHVLVSTDGKSYGHPHKEALNRYAKYDKNIKFYRTDKLGTVKIKSDGYTWSFSKQGIKISTSVSGNVTVYITKTGSRYHKIKSCKGLSNAKAIYKSSKTKAVSTGLTKCKLCY